VTFSVERDVYRNPSDIEATEERNGQDLPDTEHGIDAVVGTTAMTQTSLSATQTDEVDEVEHLIVTGMYKGRRVDPDRLELLAQYLKEKKAAGSRFRFGHKKNV